MRTAFVFTSLALVLVHCGGETPNANVPVVPTAAPTASAQAIVDAGPDAAPIAEVANEDRRVPLESGITLFVPAGFHVEVAGPIVRVQDPERALVISFGVAQAANAGSAIDDLWRSVRKENPPEVESPEPEMSHQIPPKVKGTGVLYISANFNKRQIVLDLKDEADRAKAYRLASHCDVFIQNMRTGAAEKLGFGYDDIVAVRPDVIYVTSTAYGRVGPMATDGGVDPLLQAFSGFTSVNGPPGSDGEMFRHLAHLDITTSEQALRERR